MDLKYYAEKLWYKVLYLVVVIVYLFCLNKLNHELLIQKFETPFKLLAYNNCDPMKYFFVGFILFATGCYLVCKEVKKLVRGLDEFEEIIIAIATIIVVVVLIVLIIIFIDNPILRAVMCVFLVGCGFVGAATN